MVAVRFELFDAEGDQLLDVQMPTWAGHGACAGNDQWLSLFFAEDDSHHMPTEQVLGAKGMCVGCPVMLECLGWALQNERGSRYREGIFGGLTPEERTFAAQAPDPLVFGTKLLHDQVDQGLLIAHVERWEDEDGQAERSAGP